MSRDAIATGGVVLTANTDGVSAGLAKSRDEIRGWARDANAAGGGAGGGFAAGFLGGAKGIAAGLGKAGPVGLAVGAGLAVGVAGIDIAAKKVGEVKDTLADISKQGAMASALGLTAEQFTGVAGVAKSVGEDTKEFIESLVTLGKVAADGAAGNGEVAADFFKTLNIEAATFAGLRADEQFFKFFEAVQKVQDPLARTRALMTAFGEDGGKLLLPLLAKSPGELRRMADGFAISGEQVRKATEANAKYQEATAKMDRVWKEFAVAAAPAVQGIGEALTALMPILSAVGKVAGTVFGTIGNGLRRVAAATDAVGGGLRRMFRGREQAVRETFKAAAKPDTGGEFARWQAATGKKNDPTDPAGRLAERWTPKFAGAVDVGSAEAYSMRVRNDFLGGADGAEKVPDLLKQQIKATADQTAKIDGLARAVDRLRASWETV